MFYKMADVVRCLKFVDVDEVQPYFVFNLFWWEMSEFQIYAIFAVRYLGDIKNSTSHIICRIKYFFVGRIYSGLTFQLPCRYSEF